MALFISGSIHLFTGFDGFLVCEFFFSSRRRHTTSLCDWSSDVCSSDLRQWTVQPVEKLSVKRVCHGECRQDGADADDQPRAQLADVLDECGLLAVAKPPRKQDRKSTRLNSSHTVISYAVFCLKKKKKKT